MVLPMLALLTFGTIEIAIYLQQQSTLNAAAFIAARSASVLSNQATLTKASAEGFAQQAGAAWLHDAVYGMKREDSKDRSRVTLEAKTDGLSGMISALTDGQAKGLDKLGAQATLPLEYEASKYKQTRAGAVPRTMYMVSYESTNWAPANDPSKNAISRSLPAIGKQLLPLLSPISLPLTISGGGNTPKPKPAASAAPHPKPSTGPKPAPTAAPVVTQNVKVQIPYVQDIHDFVSKVTAGDIEPFLTVGAVVANPHARRDAGDGGQFTSSEYLTPHYEKTVQPNDQTAIASKKYRIQNLVNELTSYQNKLTGQGSSGQAPTSANIYALSNGLGRFDPKTLVPAGAALGPGGAAALAAVTKKIDDAKKVAGQFAGGMATSANDAYTAKLRVEKNLFK